MTTSTTAALFALAAVVGVAGLTQSFAQMQPANNNSLLNAETISQTNSASTDSDVKNLVIMIPDNAGKNESLWQGFLPGNATIVTGTAVIWVNADVNVTHSVTLSAEDGNAIFNNSIPYQNGTAHTFEQEGKYTFTDSTSRINGTISVVQDVSDDPLTNSSAPTLGLLVVPSRAEAGITDHLNRLGFNAVSSATVEQAQSGTAGSGGADDNSTMLFVWTQQAEDSDAVINRLASKLRTLEGVLYPGDAVKQT